MAEVVVVVVAQQSGAFECHQRANVRAFILGQGWRDNDAIDVIVIGSNGGTRGRRNTSNVGRNADNILCKTK